VGLGRKILKGVIKIININECVPQNEVPPSRNIKNKKNNSSFFSTNVQAVNK